MSPIERKELMEILREVRARLEAILGDNLVEVILFGSYARGDATEGSDVDVLLLLKRWPSEEELEAITRATDEYAIDRGIVISLIPYVEGPGMAEDPLIISVQREGIKV
ncbi:hypothetical protein CL1_0488 [Thermococcus cleftensis]|uniref:Polymerase nucleotidyl transferase domain-containing protein n=1 Tax=Thermococcus cleftensis (strain DSM 27260 / KACC 17922 / CL1) TaxID=163003 RepID=I3ZSL2_THECF|nr:nucleotidyltransferase domain-containing protein [Thermococcus cleftensis]AFL94696.1 hypothetical protein CL1_0488 [Thermococcus cleftensis]